MGSSFYSETIKAIRTQLSITFGDQLRPEPFPQGSIVQHVLWMCVEVDQLPRTLDNALKAARWIGWMLHVVEYLGVWSNDASRQFIRLDVLAGNDRPDRGSLFETVRTAMKGQQFEVRQQGDTLHVPEESVNSVAGIITDAVLGPRATA